MQQRLLDCRLCKKKTRHTIIDEFDLPPSTRCVQCVSCGVMGIALVADMEPIND